MSHDDEHDDDSSMQGEEAGMDCLFNRTATQPPVYWKARQLPEAGAPDERDR